MQNQTMGVCAPLLPQLVAILALTVVRPFLEGIFSPYYSTTILEKLAISVVLLVKGLLFPLKLLLLVAKLAFSMFILVFKEFLGPFILLTCLGQVSFRN